MLIPIFGQFLGLILMLLPGNRGENSHGADPRGRGKLTEEERREKEAQKSPLRKDFDATLDGLSPRDLIEWTRREVTGRYADFEGRTRRRTFWPVAGLAVSTWTFGRILDAAVFGGFGLFSALALLALGVPFASTSARRMHDTGRPGWWAAVAVVPLVGWVALGYMGLWEGEEGANQYGPDPKSASTGAVGTA
jgi:uncharacterized membrane protein YhaH (DUF805 family)